MSLNSLGVSQLAIPAASGAGAGTNFSYASGSYAGLTPANYDVILGTAGTPAQPFVGGSIAVNLNPLNITSAAQAAACIVEAWYVIPAIPAAGGPTTIGAKYAGRVAFAAGPPATAILTLNAVDEAGAIVGAFVGTCHFRVYVPRVGFF
jgi:hypothetical protein